MHARFNDSKSETETESKITTNIALLPLHFANSRYHFALKESD